MRQAGTPAERRARMETSPGPWIEALRHSHDRLLAARRAHLDELRQLFPGF
jgi:hypothetical protein